MEGPANTLNYMIAGFVVIFGVMAAYIGSMVVRYRNLRQDEEALKELQEKNETASL